MDLLSKLISQDIQKLFVDMDIRSPQDDGSFVWKERSYCVMKTLLPLSLFMEVTEIQLDAMDFVDIGRLSGLVDSIQKKHPFSAQSVCQDVSDMMKTMPGYRKKNGVMQDECCQSLYSYIVMMSKNLCAAAKRQSSDSMATGHVIS